METPSRCTLDLIMVTETVPSIELVGLYPVNALRNRALMHAKTEVSGTNPPPKLCCLFACLLEA